MKSMTSYIKIQLKRTRERFERSCDGFKSSVGLFPASHCECQTPDDELRTYEERVKSLISDLKSTKERLESLVRDLKPYDSRLKKLSNRLKPAEARLKKLNDRRQTLS